MQRSVQLLGCAPAWDGNWTNDCFGWPSGWKGADGQLVARCRRQLRAPNQSQCRLRLPFLDLNGKPWLLQDQIVSTTVYERDGDERGERSPLSLRVL